MTNKKPKKFKKRVEWERIDEINLGFTLTLLITGALLTTIGAFAGSLYAVKVFSSCFFGMALLIFILERLYSREVYWEEIKDD